MKSLNYEDVSLFRTKVEACVKVQTRMKNKAGIIDNI